LALLAFGLAVHIVDGMVRARAIGELERQTRATAILLASGFRRELDKFQLVPVVLADDAQVRAALRSGAPAGQPSLNRKLEALSAQTGAANVYLLDAGGTTIAASNWRRPESFLGDNYGFRAYFRDALRAGSAQQFALGQRSRQPGLYISNRLSDGGRPLGVVVVKVDFRALERDWRAAANSAFVTDGRGIILVTADPSWRFQTIRDLSPRERAAARRSFDYGTAPLTPNRLYVQRQVASLGQFASPETTFVESVERVGNWRVHVLTPIGPAVAAAVTSARLVLAITALLAVAAYLLWRHRRRTDAARIAAAADARLTGLRHQLVQANKLATLGQIAAGVGHEINQPVAAIGNYAHNARTLIERERTDEAIEAIGNVLALTDRIGFITRELRGFARRATGRTERVSVPEVFDGLRLLLRDRLQMLGAEFVTEGPEAWILGERVRLEQVLVNLVQNALDAGALKITALVNVVGGRLKITVSDDGSGLSPEIRASLFQPFKTSKQNGLGLGLVISHDIVTGLGGTLTAGSPRTGAEFVIDLGAAE
jgi:two-component system C4-dicarboxylate transport sensor histidine kinase DctB